MKLLKFAFLSLFVVTLTLTSCSNDDPIVNNPDTQQSAAIRIALNELRTHVNTDGALLRNNNVSTSDVNPTGNIIFDFCFDFVYPIDLTYNTGATVTVNNFDELVDVLLTFTEDLYIDGIAFPFSVEVYDDATGSIVVQTIANEDEFIALLEGCSFDIDDCICTSEFAPVCIEILDPNGTSFIISYPNACVAECDGFTSADFVDCDGEIYNPGGDFGFGCFTLNYPISLVNDNGETITVNSDEELSNALYTTMIVNFVYPFSVTLVESGEVIQINNEEDFITVLDACYFTVPPDCDCDGIGNPVCVELTDPMTGDTFVITYPNACIAECEGFTNADYVECDGNGGGGTPCDCPTEENPVCVEYSDPMFGTVELWYPNACFAECDGFTSADFIECGTGSGGSPCDCATEENPVCVEVTSAAGTTEIIMFLNACEAECFGFSQSDFVDCN
jgi:hypothetical protein